MTKGIALFLTLLATACATVPAPPDALRQYLAEETALGFRGSVLVARGGKVIIDDSFGVPGKHPRFWLASISKAFTAVAILRLQEQGRLSVHDPITRFFSDVPDDKKAITIHHLLTHTSGLPGAYAADGIADRERAVRAILEQPLEGAIGSKWVYSGDAFTLLAAVIEIASGQSFEDYVRREVMDRARMRDSGFWGNEVNIAPIAHPDQAAKIEPTIYRDGRSVANWGFRGSTGMFSTAADVYRWTLALRDAAILTPASRELLWGPHFFMRRDAPRTDVYNGYGWMVEREDGERSVVRAIGRETWLGHNGFIWLAANGDTLIVLSNAGEKEDTAWSIRVLSGLRERLHL